MYSSPSRRICGSKCFRCARSRRLYSGIGGNKASGAGFSPLVEPAAVGIASKRNEGFMTGFSVMVCRIVENRIKSNLNLTSSRRSFLLPLIKPHIIIPTYAQVMLPTPSTSHVDTDRIYEPAEDSFLFLDTFSSEAETKFLTQRFAGQQSTRHHNEANPSPLVIEVGSGSGVVLAFITAHASAILGRADVIALGTDVNSFACKATKQTVTQACQSNKAESIDGSGCLLATMNADLTSPLRDGVVDLLIFNPPYVPSSAVPQLQYPKPGTSCSDTECTLRTFEEDSRLLQLSFDGGVDGIEVTNRLLERLPNLMNFARGAAYILLCAQNKPAEVMRRVRGWGDGWSVAAVGYSGKKAGWEKLQIIRIWRG